MNRFLSTFLFLFFVLTVVGQETVTVISLKANLRGTPDAKGIVITTVNDGEQFELIKQAKGWFLVQTPSYVGWIHGSTIKLDLESPTYNRYESIIAVEPEIKIPQTTSKKPTGDDSFQKTYVGGNGRPTIKVINDAGRKVNLTFGGVKYVIETGSNLEITVDGGNYEFSVSAPGVIPLSGVRVFNAGFSYSWHFYIVTR